MTTDKQLNGEDYQKTLDEIRNWPSQDRKNLVLTLVKENIYPDKNSK